MPSALVIALAALAAGPEPQAAQGARVIEARSGEVVTLSPPEGIAPETAHWVEISGPSILLKAGEAKGPELKVRPRLGGVYRLGCLPGESASLSRARLVELKVHGLRDTRAVGHCPMVVPAGEEVEVAAGVTPGLELKITGARWRQLSGHRLALSRDDLQRTALRLAPELPGRYRFALKVLSGRTSTPWATFTFEVPANSRGGAQRRPVARPTRVMSARLGEEVVLDGSRSADPDGEALVFRWEKLSGPPGKLLGEGARVRFVPELAGEHTFVLTVVDAAGFQSLPVPIALTVFPADEPARADPDAADPLDRPFSILLENKPVSYLLARLSDAGVTVRASGEVTRAHPFGKTKIDLWAVELPARKVLDWLGRVLGAFYVIERPGVVWFARGTKWLEREKPLVRSYRIDALYSKPDASDLVSLLREALKGALWARADLSLGAADLEPQTLTAVLPASAQLRLARVLAELRREVASGRPGGEREPASRLMSRPVRVRYENWPAREIAWDLARQTRVPVGFMPMGEEGGRRVTLDIGEAPLGEGLERLCRAAGLAGRRLEPPGVVWLFAKRPPPESSECLWSAGEVRSYDVRQLRAGHGFAGAMVAHLVKSRVLPARWKDPFVSVGYSPARGRLVVIHSPEVQRAVATFLAHLGRQGEKALAE